MNNQLRVAQSQTAPRLAIRELQSASNIIFIYLLPGS